MTKETLIQQLERRVRRAGSQQKAAKALSCSPQYLSDILKGRREPGKGFLATLGLETVTTYREIAPNE